jgi:hypothetical protein
MSVSVRLTYFDALYMSVDLEIRGDGRGVKRAKVVDRHENVLVEEAYEKPRRATVLPLDKLARSRFPLFVEVEAGNGTLHGKDEVGPIFAAPTQAEYSGGVRLPVHAVDVLNDPVIRRLRMSYAAGHATKIRYDGARRRIADRIRRLLSRSTFVLTIGAIFGAATAVILSLPDVAVSRAAPGIAVSALVLIYLAYVAVRLAKLAEENRAMAARAKEELREYEQAAGELIRLGVYRKLAMPHLRHDCDCK